MSENEAQEISGIAVSNSSNLSPQASGLAQRGLDELALKTPTLVQINAARAESADLKGLSDAAVRLILVGLSLHSKLF
jgi:hypothetical protein